MATAPHEVVEIEELPRPICHVAPSFTPIEDPVIAEQRREEAWRDYHAHWTLPPPPLATQPLESATSSRWSEHEDVSSLADAGNLLVALLLMLPVAITLLILIAKVAGS